MELHSSEFTPLTAQERLILENIYNGLRIKQNRRDATTLFEHEHSCCSDCTHRILKREADEEASECFSRAAKSERFHEIFIVWNDDRSVVAMFGSVMHVMSEELFFLGGWGKENTPTFEELLKERRKLYREARLERGLNWIMLATGIFLLIYGSTSENAVANNYALFVGTVFTIAGVVCAIVSVRRRILLFSGDTDGQSIPNPNNEPA